MMFRYRMHLDQQLINEIENRPILWDRTLYDYRRTSLRDLAWKEVSRVLQISSSECKRRWRTLRDSFVKYHRSRHNEGRGSDPSRKRMWIFYDIMSFLIPHIDSRESSAIDHQENADDTDFETSAGYRDAKTESLLEKNFESAESSENRFDVDDYSTDGYGTNDSYSPQESNASNKCLDAEEQFLISYAPVLKRLSPQKNAQARLKIQQILYEIEFEEDP